MNYFKKLSEFIFMKIDKTGLSQSKFCVEYELESSTLNRYVNGQRVPKLDILAKFAAAFGQTLGEFLTEFEQQND